MPEHDAELAALRAADPVDPASLPSATHPVARALFERIIMTDTTTEPTGTRDSAAGTARPHRRRLVLAAAAAVLTIVLAGAVAFNSDGDDGDAPETDRVATGPITPGGPSTASCVEVYDRQTLANRETAFDGTVAAVDGDSVSFTVNEWYRGGDTAEITLSGATGLTGLTSAGPDVGLEPGTRLLVAGDGGFAWACGFTQPYDAAVANEWRQVLGD